MKARKGTKANPFVVGEQVRYIGMRRIHGISYGFKGVVKSVYGNCSNFWSGCGRTYIKYSVQFIREEYDKYNKKYKEIIYPVIVCYSRELEAENE